MTYTTSQTALFANEEGPSLQQVVDFVVGVLCRHEQPSAWELVNIVERELGWKARWSLKAGINELMSAPSSKRAWRGYLDSLTKSGDLDAALRGIDAPKKEIASSIDSLLRHSKVYRYSEKFREMVNFMARFRDYAPYNNMLVRLQNPTCSFFATERDWCDRFGRNLKEDARPMLILAPMHPVMLVYALDETEGKDVPEELKSFAAYQGQWNPDWLQRTVQNAAVRDRIRVDFKILSSTNAGFATLAHSTGEWKMRIAIHSHLDEPSQYGTLCHELAHIYLGHLGTDRDHWWPSRTELDCRTIEIEAESTAFIVTSRLGLAGSSAAYVSRYLDGRPLPSSVSLDQVAKVASRIEQMSDQRLRPRERRGNAQS
ncbi:MAG: ImmA/IrrE family metallo-endopeptidase [Terriglobales bacterium]